MLPTMPPAIRCSKSANNGVAAVSRRFERCSHVSFGRPDWLAGHVGLELRNVDANYPLERSHRFAGIQPNSGLGDYSRLSCEGGRRNSGPSVRISVGCLRWQELPRFSADAEMIRRRPIQQYHCSLAFSRARINAVIVEHWKEISDARTDSSCCFSTAQESDSRSNVSLATQFFSAA